MTAAGSGALSSVSVSSSDTASPLESLTLHSSSSAAIVELEICTSASWNSLDAQLQLGGHLLVARRALQLMLELGVGALDLPRPRADRPRHPVQRAQLVDDRALDPRDRVGLELDLALDLEALDRVDQPHQPIGDEVGLLDVRGQPAGHPPRHVLHQRRVRDHQTLARVHVAAALVAAPQIPQLDGFDVGLHHFPTPVTPADDSVHRRISGGLTLLECRSASC